MVNCKMKNPLPGSIPATDFLLYPMLYCKSQACNTDNALSVMALPPRAAVHTVLAKPMALQLLLAALQTTPLLQ